MHHTRNQVSDIITVDKIKWCKWWKKKCKHSFNEEKKKMKVTRTEEWVWMG